MEYVAPAKSDTVGVGEVNVLPRRVGSAAIFRLRAVVVGFGDDATNSILATWGSLGKFTVFGGGTGLILLNPEIPNILWHFGLVESVLRVVRVIRLKRSVNEDTSEV